MCYQQQKMVVIEEEIEAGKSARNCKKSSGRRCYAVKVCIEKNPTSKTTKAKLTDQSVRTEEQCLPDCPPPPIIPPPLRIPVRICCACEPIISTGRKSKRRRTKKHEKECQTHPHPPPCRKSERETQCSLGPSKVFQDSHCQTSPKELKHCGHQAGKCCENATKHCQTDLERACCAEGVAHDRKACVEPCCKKPNEKRDIACQQQSNQAVNRKPVTNCPPTNNRKKCGNRAACEEKYEFPFVGRTSSGNLKVRPSMVSYENKEFGILVADPNAIRTTVKRITSCDMTDVEEEKASQCPILAPPPAPPTYITKYFSCREAITPCSSSRESCKTVYPKPPRLPQPSRFHHKAEHQHRKECDHVDLELLQSSYYTGRLAHGGGESKGLEYTVKPVVVEREQISHNGIGHIDGWNYVNPVYQGAQRRDHHHHKVIPHHARHFHHPRGKQEEVCAKKLVPCEATANVDLTKNPHPIECICCKCIRCSCSRGDKLSKLSMNSFVTAYICDND